MQIEIEENSALINAIMQSDKVLPLLFESEEFRDYFCDETVVWLSDDLKLIIGFKGDSKAITYTIDELLAYYFNNHEEGAPSTRDLEDLINSFEQLVIKLKQLKD